MSKLLFLIPLCLILSSCIKENKQVEFNFEQGNVIDNEGKVYKTIKIGEQWWMAEDLKSTRLTDGTPIINNSDKQNWSTTNLPQYIVGNNGSLLYNYYVIEKGIAPKGWRVPSDEDFKKLEIYLGMSNAEVNKINWRGTDEGNKIKDSYQNRNWNRYKDLWSLGETGFNATPCGCVLFNGNMCDPEVRSQGFWWTSSLNNNAKEAWFRYLDYKENRIFRYHAIKNHGYAIRCIKE